MKCVRTQIRFFFILGRSRGPNVKGAYCRPPHGPMSACSPFGNLAGKEFALIISCETPRKGPQHWNGVTSAADAQQCPGLRVLASGGNIVPYLSPRPSSSPAASPPPCSIVALQGQRPRTLLSPNAIPPTRRSALLSAPSAPPSARTPLCPRHAPLRSLPGVTLLSFHSMRPATDAARHHGKCLAKHSYRRSDPIGRRFSSLPRDSWRSPRPRRFPARPASPA